MTDWDPLYRSFYDLGYQAGHRDRGEEEAVAADEAEAVAGLDRQALTSTILDSFATHDGKTWLELAEHAADAVIRAGEAA